VKKELRLVLLAREKKIGLNIQGMSNTVPCFKEQKKQNSVVSVRKANYTDRATAACRRS
jgi:hypothetical protein